jgi:tRNA dimethylallyltransferase
VTGRVLGLFGPTAAGKSAVASVLRDRLGAEVVSADSAALYQSLPVLTAAPPYPARLVGTVPLDCNVSVGEYQHWAHAAVDDILEAGGRPLVAGGTGLYFRAALSSLAIPPPPTDEERARWQDVYDRVGPEGAHALLAERDPAAAARVHANDRKRIVRALELAEAGGSLAPAENRLWTAAARHPTLVFVLDLPLEELDRRIERRTRAMAVSGAADEARRAWARPLSDTARKVLGLEQFATLPLAEAVAEVEQATKRLARYQRKWLRSLRGAVTLDGNRPAEEIADELVALGRTGECLSRHS